MFERFINCIVSFHIVCRLRYTTSCLHPTHNPAYILSASRRISCLCPVYILCMSDIHPACTRRAVLSIIFGHILPSVISYRGFLNKSCARDIPLFYPLLLLSFIDVREIYDLHCIIFILCVFYDTLHTACIRRASGVHPTFIRRAPDVQSFLSSSVIFYLRSYLTADS